MLKRSEEVKKRLNPSVFSLQMTPGWLNSQLAACSLQIPLHFCLCVYFCLCSFCLVFIFPMVGLPFPSASRMLDKHSPLSYTPNMLSIPFSLLFWQLFCAHTHREPCVTVSSPVDVPIQRCPHLCKPTPTPKLSSHKGLAVLFLDSCLLTSGFLDHLSHAFSMCTYKWELCFQLKIGS